VKNKLLSIAGFWWPAVLWMAVIFTVSTESFSTSNTSSLLEPWLFALFPQFSDEQIELIHWSLRKLGHWFGYFVLGLLILRTVGAQFPFWQAGRRAIFSLVLAIVYAITDEWHQSFVPSRSASFFDVLLDSFGAFFGVLCWQRLSRAGAALHEKGKKLDKLRANREDMATIRNTPSKK